MKVINVTMGWEGRDEIFELNMKPNLPGSRGLMKISSTVTESFLALKWNVMITVSIPSKIQQYLFSQLPSVNTFKIRLFSIEA